MKIRIRGNSVRLRLSRTEVSQLAAGSQLQEKTQFPGSEFTYTLRESDAISNLDASFSGSEMTMSIPRGWAATWAGNDQVGFQHNLPLPGGNSLYLLLEKDFKCIDAPPGEDQSDNYEHPKGAC